MSCVFCDRNDAVFSNEFAYAIYDQYPVNIGHMLIVSKRHFASFFDAGKKEIEAILDLINQGKAHLEATFHPDGYNIGINIGETAGQTIMHLHIHLIPRYKGDLENPRGGVRGVIPEKRIY